MFAVHLPRVPKTDVLGGARLRPDAVICRIEPYGVVQFAQRSRVVEVTEGDEPTEVTGLTSCRDGMSLVRDVSGRNVEEMWSGNVVSRGNVISSYSVERECC